MKIYYLGLAGLQMHTALILRGLPRWSPPKKKKKNTMKIQTKTDMLTYTTNKSFTWQNIARPPSCSVTESSRWAPGLWNRACPPSGGLCRPAAGCGWRSAAGGSHRPCYQRRWCWPRLQRQGGTPHHRRRSRTALRDKGMAFLLWCSNNSDTEKSIVMQLTWILAIMVFHSFRNGSNTDHNLNINVLHGLWFCLNWFF